MTLADVTGPIRSERIQMSPSPAPLIVPPVHLKVVGTVIAVDALTFAPLFTSSFGIVTGVETLSVPPLITPNVPAALNDVPEARANVPPVTSMRSLLPPRARSTPCG